MRVSEKLLRIRGELIDSVNLFFKKRGFLRVETPSIYLLEESNPHISSIKAILHKGGKEIEATLITSPEIYMKRLIAGGLRNIYQLCRFYRDDEFGELHNPEFLGLEFYEVQKSYIDTMNTTEDLIKFLVKEHNLMDSSIELIRPFKRIRIIDLLREYGLRLNSLEDMEELKEAVRGKISISESDTYEDLFFKYFITYIEPELKGLGPVFLYDYPPSMCSMAKISVKGGIRVSERYELYIKGVEICNGFSELTDPIEQEERLKRDLKSKGSKKGYDRVFVDSLKNLPECSGNAIGLDRLFMVLLNLKSIKDVLPFPLEEEIELYEV